MNNATIGAPAAIEVLGGWGHTRIQTGYVVAHVTPKGRVTVRRVSDGYERKFDAKGRELGRGEYHAARLRLDVDAVDAEVNERARRSAAADALNAVTINNAALHTNSAESLQGRLQELEALLAAARAAVAAI